jgi:hypothetical protein
LRDDPQIVSYIEKAPATDFAVERKLQRVRKYPAERTGEPSRIGRSDYVHELHAPNDTSSAQRRWVDANGVAAFDLRKPLLTFRPRARVN